MKYFPLGQILISDGLLTQEQLDDALDRQRISKKRLGEILIEMRVVTERDIYQTLAKKLGVEFVESPLYIVDEQVARSIPEAIARKYKIVGVNLKQGSIVVATTDPLNFEAIEDVAMVTGLNVKTVISFESEIEKTISRVYSNSEDSLVESLDERESKLSKKEIEEANMESRVDSAPIVKLVNSIISEAYSLNASDIHIEPEESETRIRFRIDGDLLVYKVINRSLHNLVTTRIKLIAGINIAEKRIPQDGSFKYVSDYVKVDMRVSSLPTPFGEKLVLRLLGADKNITYDLHSLGLSDQTVAKIEKAIRVPHGIFLVTGPTGSGKTTTLYSILHNINDEKRSIVTVEDPVERNFSGITQVQINHKAGLTFASGLRSILRQDPDTIMVGEIRDGETAEIAIRAAITGHFVLSTLHTNDALSAVPRLIDMGVEPFMVASSLKAVVAQRLVKKICHHCAVDQEVRIEENRLLNNKVVLCAVGEGCVRCNNTGYLGRTAVFEVILVDRQLQELIAKRASMDELRSYVDTHDIRGLREELVDLVNTKQTTIEEAVRILYNVD